MSSRETRYAVPALSLVVILAVALLPWWHNRGFLRSFFDYGVVMGGVGRIQDAQRPYVDFITPIQTGWYAINWAFERLAGGTFQAMTWSGAATIAAAVAALGGILLRVMPSRSAAILTGAVVCATVSQHTIMWYNPWGVVLLAVVAWSGAVAPVLRRTAAGWHTLTALAFILGGINKINMQILALCLAAGWGVRAALLHRARWRDVSLLLIFLGIVGVVLPVLAEMAWTGATFDVWWHNVIAQMAGDRAGMIQAGMRWEFLLKPQHDYYESLRLPQVGLFGVMLTLATTVAILRHASGEQRGRERALGLAGGMVAYLAGEALLATNMDIAYTALGGWLALLVALWLGFGLPTRGAWFHGCLVVPAAIIALLAWEAAWRGQRSQFGHARAARSDYRDAGEAGPEFAYLRGTRVPPEIFLAVQAVGDWRRGLAAERSQAVLYGPGTEWLAHIWTALSTPALPLYILGGHQFGPKEYAATYAALENGHYREITVSRVQDVWKPELARVLDRRYTRHSLADVFFHYSRAPDDRIWSLPLDGLGPLGGTTDPRRLLSLARIIDAGDGRSFVGATNGQETMLLNAPTNRVKGQVIIRRNDPEFVGPAAVDFSIFAEADADHRYPRWAQRVELPAGSIEATADYEVDGSRLLVRFQLEIPGAFAGKIAAGWRGPVILDAGTDGPDTPAWLRPVPGVPMELSATQVRDFFPSADDGRPSSVWVRKGRPMAGGIELAPGGEVWSHLRGQFSEIKGEVQVAGLGPGSDQAVVRIYYLKGARIDVLSQFAIARSQGAVGFQAWSPEAGGWLVMAIDPVDSGPGVAATIRSATPKR